MGGGYIRFTITFSDVHDGACVKPENRLRAHRMDPFDRNASAHVIFNFPKHIYFFVKSMDLLFFFSQRRCSKIVRACNGVACRANNNNERVNAREAAIRGRPRGVL